MKLGVVWNENDGEGRLSKTDSARLIAMSKESFGDRIAVLDFLMDAKNLVDELYDKVQDSPYDTIKVELTMSSR